MVFHNKFFWKSKAFQSDLCVMKIDKDLTHWIHIHSISLTAPSWGNFLCLTLVTKGHSTFLKYFLIYSKSIWQWHVGINTKISGFMVFLMPVICPPVCTEREIKQSLSARKKDAYCSQEEIYWGHKAGYHGKTPKIGLGIGIEGGPWEEYSHPSPTPGKGMLVSPSALYFQVFTGV